MKFFRVVTFLFVFISVISGNVASATMLCCLPDYSNAKPTQVDNNKAEMLCHQNTEKPHSKKCTDCKNCVSANFVIFTEPSYQISLVKITHDITVSGFVSALPIAIYPPPKYIS
jgi:hypothetical protein